jgi:hypothetical protein
LILVLSVLILSVLLVLPVVLIVVTALLIAVILILVFVPVVLIHFKNSLPFLIYLHIEDNVIICTEQNIIHGKRI